MIQDRGSEETELVIDFYDHDGGDKGGGMMYHKNQSFTIHLCKYTMVTIHGWYGMGFYNGSVSFFFKKEPAPFFRVICQQQKNCRHEQSLGNSLRTTEIV